MRLVTALVAALTEAWGEVKVQKARVVLSLIGVVAAVAAMSTVIALGDLIVQSNKEEIEAISGRSVTLTLTPSKKQGDSSSDSQPLLSQEASGYEAGGYVEEPAADEAGAGDAGDADGDGGQQGWSDQATGVVSDPASAAMVTVADRFEIPYWSRMQDASVQLAEVDQVKQTGTFRGVPVEPAEEGFDVTQVKAVDPGYKTIFRLRMVQGRWLRPADIEQRVMPVVINSSLWEYFGKPSIDDPLVVTSSRDSKEKFRVVGVVHSSMWDMPTLYAPFDAWQLSGEASSQSANADSVDSGVSMLVWSSPQQVQQARESLRSALTSVLGEGWEVVVETGDEIGGYGSDGTSSTRGVVMVIGWIVIGLGALGLLNVAIVTVRQRIREIGIRRAVGASARRVFFAIFLESVIATFIAGVLGVAIAVVVLRHIPLEGMGISLQERPAFPVPAAVAGVGIASSVGALCGIIPALAATRVRPIDAIRQ